MPSKYLALLMKPRNLRVITICLGFCTLSIAVIHLYNGIIVTQTQDPSISPYPTSVFNEAENYIADNLENVDGDSVEDRRTNPGGRSRTLDGSINGHNAAKQLNVHASRIRQQEPEINNLQSNGPGAFGRQRNGQAQEESDLVSTQFGTRSTSTATRNNGSVATQASHVSIRKHLLPHNANTTKCRDYPQFEPDIDAVKMYPTLPFEANWIRYREYWNTFFEARYQDSMKSGQIPHLKVFVIPHSHNDPGWVKTFDEYFYQQTKHILDNSIDKLMEHKSMTFQWSEMSFLSKWWDYAHPLRKQNLLRLIDENRFEIVTGGWVMTDEATVHLYSMIDQLIEGQQWAKNHLNAIPKSSWSVDPFGHGNAQYTSLLEQSFKSVSTFEGSTMPYLLKASGIKSMVIQRIHYAWKKWLAEQQYGDFLWVQRWDNSPTAKSSIFCHNAPFDIYSIKHSCGPHPHICLNFDFRNISGEFSENHMYFQPITPLNVKEKAELLLEQYGKTGSLFPHNVAMISLGDDFRYDHAIEWDQQYTNYLQLFNYINSNFKTYRTEIKFATISEYFQAVGERVDLLPTFAGDFFVYSDIFSEGRPAYWSGYYGTRPYWKKFYRETENAVRSAEILFSFANVLASQKNQRINSQVLVQEYSNLIRARRHLALFAHHDATTGTSKVETMNDYGYKLMDAMQKSLEIQMIAANSILFSQTNNTHLSTDFEQLSFGDLPQKIPLKLNKINERKIVLFNSLGWSRNHLVKVIVTLPNIRVIGPTGKNVPSQLNPVMDVTNDRSSRISTQLYELTFVAELLPLSLYIFTLKQTTLDNENCAIRSAVYCNNCSDPSNLFQINKIQAGNIQLTSDRLQLLFDRNSGLLLTIGKVKDAVSIRAGLTFGAYDSIGHRSGAYLLMIDPLDEVKTVPYPFNDARIFIISGPIASEVSVFHSPLVVTTRLMHTGGTELEESIHIQNQIDVGQQSGEVFMRLDTDLDSRTIIGTKYDAGQKQFVNLARVETFYTDENGFGIEKRIKIPSISLEGNYYPVTTNAFIQDEVRGLRFSVLVDRSHGFSSYEAGRLETLIERRTVYDDGRGMGEGVTDNRETISNYILTLETIKPTKMSRSTNNAKGVKSNVVVPTLTVQHMSQQLNYPPSLFMMNYENFPRKTSSTTVFTMLSSELPCDVHLINFRTLTESSEYNVDLNMPSKQALMIFQRLGYLCPYSSSANSSNNLVQMRTPDSVSCTATSGSQSLLLHEGTNFNRIQVQNILESDLTGTVVRANDAATATSRYTVNNTQPFKTSLDELEADPFEIKSFILKFS